MGSMPSKSSNRTIRILLWVCAIAEVAYFTASHWFYHRLFFNTLGIKGPILESTFVISQLQLIGALVLGYAALTLLAASDPPKHRSTIKVVLVVGAMATAIFVGNIALGRLPIEFGANAVVLVLQIVLVSWLYPWSQLPRSVDSTHAQTAAAPRVRAALGRPGDVRC